MNARASTPGNVIVVGSVNVDLTVQTTRLPSPGETVIGRGLSRRPGGKGANQAVAAALMGAPTHLIACAGQDPGGDFVCNSMREAGVDISLVQREEHSATGTAVITVDDTAENVIVVSPGANAELDSQTVQEALGSIERASVLCLSLEISLQTTFEAARAARRLGAKTLLNLSPYSAKAKRILPLVDVVVLNEGEALAAVGLFAAPAERPWQVVGALLGETGAKNAVITLGSKGSIVLANLQTWPIIPVGIEPLRVDAVDTTGCGDAFTGALAAKIAAEADLVSSASFASKVAAYAATLPGAQASYPSLLQFESWLSENSTSKAIRPEMNIRY